MYLLRCCEKINPQRIKDTPAVNFFSRLGSTPSIFKRLTERVIFYMLLLKMFNVSEAARTPLVLCSNKFACKLAAQKCTRMYTSGQVFSKRGFQWI
ncbi:hypothetical protein JO41_11255 [Treponema sp. OMZ 838]|nr:hypothetical protein JO41_11255 [Treponema sp. OMZ 838]